MSRPAYFAANYKDLTTGDSRDEQWKTFKTNITAPFIEDVLDGASEWRILGPTPFTTPFETTPLTMLLAETFDRRLLAKGKCSPTFDLPEAPPLILNTTIVGHPLEDSDALRTTINEPTGKLARGEFQRPYNLVNGGRLIFTNLKNVSAFPGQRRKSHIPDTRLPYEIVRDLEVQLARAAALNANFPPVFPNALVVVKGHGKDAQFRPDRWYFVTDGGAEENLGLVSALFAIQSALQDIERRCREQQPGSQKGSLGCPRPLRPIHVVIAQASGAGYDYAQDRGLSAAVSGARERMTGGLTNVLIEQINDLYRKVNGTGPDAQNLHFHYLALPLAFRARGGFGTHWMHADRIEMTDPRLRVPFGKTIILEKGDLNKSWTALHEPENLFCARRFEKPELKTVQRWICGPPRDPPMPRDLHVEEWQDLVEELGATSVRR